MRTRSSRLEATNQGFDPRYLDGSEGRFAGHALLPGNPGQHLRKMAERNGRLRMKLRPSLRRTLSLLSFFLALVFSAPTPALAQTYSRILSLKPNITEILFFLGVGDRVVSDTTYCTRPEAAKKLPKVADYIQVFPEVALSLQPDLILGSTENSSQKEVYFLIDRGKTVKLFPFSTLAETMQSIEAIGTLVGKSEEAKKIVREM